MPLKKQFLKSRPEVKVTFEVEPKTATDANQVFLLGEFNKWEPIELKKLKSGGFKAVVSIPTDKQERFEFKYRLLDLDGREHFENDCAADGYCPNEFGEENSVLEVMQP
jgi:1,4-alpha-glucan branching enzyme